MSKSAHWIDDYLSSFNITQEMGPPRSCDWEHSYYIVVGIGGELAEGDGKVYASSKRNAERLYWAALKSIIDARDWTHIVWRTRPEVEGFTARRLGKGSQASPSLKLWSVYSRLVGYPQ